MTWDSLGEAVAAHMARLKQRFFLGGRHVLGHLSVSLCEEGVQGSGFVKGPLRESAVLGYLGDDGTSKHRNKCFRRAAGV